MNKGSLDIMKYFNPSASFSICDISGMPIKRPVSLTWYDKHIVRGTSWIKTFTWTTQSAMAMADTGTTMLVGIWEHHHGVAWPSRVPKLKIIKIIGSSGLLSWFWERRRTFRLSFLVLVSINEILASFSMRKNVPQFRSYLLCFLHVFILQTVRFLNGSLSTNGVVQFKIEDEWYTACAEAWTEHMSNSICHWMGLG